MIQSSTTLCKHCRRPIFQTSWLGTGHTAHKGWIHQADRHVGCYGGSVHTLATPEERATAAPPMHPWDYL